MHNSDPHDIDVDWFYKGKRKSKRSVSTSVPKDRPKEKAAATARHGQQPHGSELSDSPAFTERTNAVSSPQLRPQPQPDPPSHTLTPTSSVGSQPSVPSPTTTQTQPPAPGRSLLSKALRPRSNSDSKAKVSSATRPTQQPSTPPAPASTGSALARSTSLQSHNKPKKTNSLFSVFSKKKTVAPSTPPQPIHIPNSASSSVMSSPATGPTLGSSLESLSPRVEHLGQILFPPGEQNRVVLNKNPNRSMVPIKELTDVRLRRVTFALDKLRDDPPQQIPSRRPRKGNITVVDDLIGEPLKLSIGITNETKVEQKQYDEKDLRMARELQKRSLEEAEKHAQEAHKAAQRIASEVINYKNKQSKFFNMKEDEVDEKITSGVSELEIDKPIHLHEQNFEDEIIHGDENDDHEVSLEQIYTRCCHLREILPIPATLKQLKNKTSPLQTLKLLNPKPTLIDVYSFSDFISIVPIKNVIFDNVTMSTEMLKIILSSLVRSTTIQKLSLRNVPIDDQGWKFLCKFLTRNRTILKLDISQQKIKADLPLSQHRAEMDWSLFADTLNHRGGIEELIINGCKLPVPTFGRLVDEGVSRATKRFGVSQTDLTLEHVKVLANWISREGSTCEGLDIGYNNLSLHEDMLKPLIKKVQNAHQLQSISLNSTNLTNVEDVALMVRSLSKLPNLRFLDLSNLSPIFPGILPYLNKYLPRFPNLNRIHLDGNEFSTKSVSILAEIIPKCENLVHISITGISTISYAASAALYSAAKASRSLVNFDLDYDLIDEKISSRIAVCLMRNMESTLHDEEGSDTHDDILFDGSLIAETASKLLDKITTTSDLGKDDFSKKFLKTQFLEKISAARQKINRTMDELMYKRDHDQRLSLEEKEDLLRFYFLDTSLANILEIFENLPDDESSATPSTPTPQSAPPPVNPQHQADIQPHQMALEVNEGKATPIDAVTGRPIFLRSLSQTSVQAKKQEEEEGEFHRWGFFVQQQGQMLSQDVPSASDTASGTFVPQLPSGAQLRSAVIKAKGIESISSLIDNVNKKTFKLENIYPVINEDKDAVVADDDSLNSDDADDNIQEVDEAYDKLLNDLSRVRSNK